MASGILAQNGEKKGFTVIPKKPKKPKQVKLSTLVDKADKLASVYVRMKFSDYAGNIVCITCEKYLPWKEAHNAHYIERKFVNTRWHEMNLAPACAGCNMFNKEFHKRQYTFYMLDKYGREAVEELKELGRKVVSPTQKRLLAENAITYYTEAIKSL